MVFRMEDDSGSYSGIWTASTAEAMRLVSCVAACMLAGSCMSLIKAPSEKFVGCLQHLGAGIVLSAVSVELIQIITATPSGDANSNWATVFAIIIGFALGTALLVALSHLGGHDDDNSRNSDEREPLVNDIYAAHQSPPADSSEHGSILP